MKITGKVVKGRGKGERLGFPTANIRLNKNIGSGVYKGKAKAREWRTNDKRMGTKEWLAGIFVGEDKKMLEAHLIDFSGDLYGQEIEVEIGEKIREVMKFNGNEELKEQIKKDIEYVCSQG